MSALSRATMCRLVFGAQLRPLRQMSSKGNSLTLTADQLIPAAGGSEGDPGHPGTLMTLLLLLEQKQTPKKKKTRFFWSESLKVI